MCHLAGLLATALKSIKDVQRLSTKQRPEQENAPAEVEADLPKPQLLVPADCWLLMPVPGQVSHIKKQRFMVKFHKNRPTQNQNPSPFPVVSLWKELRCFRLSE